LYKLPGFFSICQRFIFIFSSPNHPMKRFLVVVCFLVAGFVKNFAQPCTFTVNAGPDTTICANQSAYLHGTVTPSAGAYTYSWTPTGSLIGATTLTPVASPLDTTTYILSVTSGGCTAIDSVHVNVSGAALILQTTITPTTPICPGTLVQLNSKIVPNLCGVAPACTNTNTTPSIGNGTGLQGGGATGFPTIMGNYDNSGRNQMLYTAAELTAALGGACTLNGIGFNLGIFNSNAYLQNFTINIACTNLTSLTTFNNNLVQVLAPSTIQPSSTANHWNDFAFTQAYNWDGVSNLIVDVCWNDPTLHGNQNNKAQYTVTLFTSYLYANANGVDLCGSSVVPNTSQDRPNIRFGFCLPNIDEYPIIWTPATGPNAVNKPDSADPTAHPVTSQAYTIAVSNGACVTTQTVNAQVDNSTVSAGPDISSCPGSAVTLTADTTGTILPGPAAFTWTTLAGGAVGTGKSVVVHPAVNTTYVVSMTGGTCAHTDTVNVTLGSLNIDTAVTNVTCFGDHNGKIVITASNGTTPYSYTWNANPNPGNSNTAINLGEGTYTVTVSDVNSCSGTSSVYVNQPGTLVNSGVTTSPLKCYGDQTASITTTFSGGTRPYTYAWSNPLPPDSFQTGLGAATYYVTVSDANGCSVTTNIVISAPPQIVFGTAVIQNDKCPNSTTGKITVTPTGGTGAYTYKWSQNAALNSPTAQNLTAASYIVTVTDAEGCTASSSNTVNAAIAVTFNAPTINNAKCFGGTGSATINPSGGAPPYSYLWTPSGQTTQTATNLAAQAYTISVTDDSLCITTTTLTITQPGLIAIIADSVNVLCNGNATGSIVITATTNAASPVSYAWGVSAGSATTPAVNNLAANTYSVTVTDANNCQQSRTFNITQPTALVINPATPVNDRCLNGATGSIAASATGGTGTLNYTWSNTATTAAISNLPAGTYVLTVTDANSCTVTQSYTVTQPANGPALSAVVDIAQCYGASTGSITLTPSGGTPGYTYTWSANAPQANSPSATGLAAGTYYITATDAGGCSVIDTSIVNQGIQITFGLDSVINVSCHGLTNGSAEVYPSGGAGGPYTYTWNGTAGNNPQNDLAANSYTVVVQDGNGCTASTTVVVTQPGPVMDSIERVNVRCNGGNDGSLTAFGYGGNPPFAYQWGDGSTTQLDSELAVAVVPYSVTITDSKGCNTVATASITQPPLLTFTFTVTQVTCPGLEDGTITAVGSGGTPPYDFSVTKDFTNFVSTNNGVATQLDSGSYTIILTDGNGCPLTHPAYINYPVPDSFSVIVDSTTCFGQQYADGSIWVTAYTVNNMPYTYTIDSGQVQDTSYFGNLAAGPHYIVATNQFGCTTNIDTTVSQPGQAYVTVLPTDTTLQLGQSVTLISGFSPYSLSNITSYNWVPSMGLSCVDCPNPVATPYGHVSEYYLTITYNGLCVASDSMQIIVENQSKPFIPNSFTPNGDGNNDVFEIYGENIKTVKLRVFNRWGELVYESTNQFKGWDGTYKGVLQNPGVYTYDAEIIFLDDTQVEKHGSVTLIR
jgi:gliding motility-associated-like protein